MRRQSSHIIPVLVVVVFAAVIISVSYIASQSYFLSASQQAFSPAGKFTMGPDEGGKEVVKHGECRDGSCVQVLGEGVSQCSLGGSECNNKRLRCSGSYKCELVDVDASDPNENVDHCTFGDDSTCWGCNDGPGMDISLCGRCSFFDPAHANNDCVSSGSGDEAKPGDKCFLYPTGGKKIEGECTTVGVCHGQPGFDGQCGLDCDCIPKKYDPDSSLPSQTDM